VSIPLCDTFEERDSRALGLIRTHLACRLVTKYASYSSSKGLWDALKKDFFTDNKVELAFHTLNALHGIKLHLQADTTNVTFSVMEKHVETVANLINELDNRGFGLDADLQPLYLLCSLPRSSRFDTLQASILGSVPSGTKLTLDDVEKKLLAQAESDTGDSASDTETDTAAVARTTRPSAATAPNTTLPNCYCHFHKSNTHNTAECKVLKDAVKQGKGKGKGRTKAEKANSAKDSDTGDDATAHVASVSSKIYCQVSAYIVRDSKGTYAIIIDSGASCTMTCDPRFFESASIRPLSPPRQVRLGDNSTCDAIAIGTMRLSCKTCHGMVDLTIKDALLVPNFAVTLVSVHQLASKKLSSHFTGDTCIVRNDKTGRISLGNRPPRATDRRLEIFFEGGASSVLWSLASHIYLLYMSTTSNRSSVTSTKSTGQRGPLQPSKDTLSARVRTMRSAPDAAKIYSRKSKKELLALSTSGSQWDKWTIDDARGDLVVKGYLEDSGKGPSFPVISRPPPYCGISAVERGHRRRCSVRSAYSDGTQTCRLCPRGRGVKCSPNLGSSRG
jgi:hypothetical protein